MKISCPLIHSSLRLYIADYSRLLIAYYIYFIPQVWAPAWFNARTSINWDMFMCYPNLSLSSLVTMERNELEGVDFCPATNELAERVFRLINEKIVHSKSIQKLEKQMLAYFNDSAARLN